MTSNGQTDPTPVFSVEKIYLQDASLETPLGARAFFEREVPQVEIQLTNGAAPVDNGLQESSVTVTITAKIGDKTLFLAEAKMAGLFRVVNIPAEDMPYLMGVTCPNILFPYVREAISDLVTRAGFPPVILSPVNFEGLYQQRLQEAQSQATSAPALAQ